MNIVIAVTAGFFLDLLLGDPAYPWHPVRLMGNLITYLTGRLRLTEGDKTVTGKAQRKRGLLMVLIVTAVSTLIPLLILKVLYLVGFWPGLVFELIFCYQLLAAGSLRRESMKVYKAAAAGDVEGARHAVSMIVGRDTSVLGLPGILRAAVETVAENTSDGVVAPLIFMSIFGAPGAFFYKAVNTMDSMVGYKNEKYMDFGRAAAKLDDIVNFLPARLSGLFMVVSAGLLGYDQKNAWKIFLRDRKKHASPNSAQTEAACAGALRLRLAGDAWYFGELHKKPYIGDDMREIVPADIIRANRLMMAASALTLILCMTVRALVLLLIMLL